MNTILTLLLSVVGSQLISVVTLMLRLRSRSDRARQRHETLTALAAGSPTKSIIELDEGTDGGYVRVRLTAGPVGPIKR